MKCPFRRSQAPVRARFERLRRRPFSQRSGATNEARFGHQRAPVGFTRDAPPPDPFFVSFSTPTVGVAADGVTNALLQYVAGRNTIVYQFLDNFSYVKGPHAANGTDIQSSQQ